MKAQIVFLLCLFSLTAWANPVENMRCTHQGEIFSTNEKELNFVSKAPKFSNNIKSFFEKRLKTKSLKSLEFKNVSMRVSRDFMDCESGDRNNFSCAGSPKELILEIKANYSDEYASGSYSVYTTAQIENMSVQSSEITKEGFNLQTIADLTIEGEHLKIEFLQLFGTQENCSI